MLDLHVVTEKELMGHKSFFKKLDFAITPEGQLIFTNLPNTEFNVFESQESYFEGGFTDEFVILYNSENSLYQIKTRSTNCSFVIFVNFQELKQLTQCKVVFEAEFDIM